MRNIFAYRTWLERSWSFLELIFLLFSLSGKYVIRFGVCPLIVWYYEHHVSLLYKVKIWRQWVWPVAESMLESKKREILKIKKKAYDMFWQIRWDKSWVWKVSIGWWDQGCSCIWPSQKSKMFSALAAKNLHKKLKLVAGTPEWVKDWITRILNANQYLLDLLTSAVSAFCLGWSIASDTFSSLFQTHIFKFI